MRLTARLVNKVNVVLPLFLLLVAVLCGAVVAYGTEPVWASVGVHGVEVILWSRRLQWPLVVTAVLLCISLGVLVITGKRRIWWMIGALPIAVLLYHRFSSGPAVGLHCVQDPKFATATDINFLQPDDLVVGLTIDGTPYAFPYSGLTSAPVIVESGRGKPAILLWSALANRAVAYTAARELRAADLEVVSTADNSLVVFNTRLGQFINGVTGHTFKGELPTDFREFIPVEKTTWKMWLASHPQTLVMLVATDAPRITSPAIPKYKMPGAEGATGDQARRVAMVASTQPIAVAAESITERPLNLVAGQSSILLVRIDGVIRAYNRELPGDLIPRFAPVTDPKHKTAVWVDSDTNSEWTSTGQVVEGPPETKGMSLKPIAVEDELYLSVMKFWYPDLKVASDSEIAAATVVPNHTGDKPTSGPQRRRLRKN